MLALLIIACSPDEPDLPLEVLDDSGTPDTSDTAVDTDTTPPDTGPADTEPPPVTEEVIGDHTLEDDWIFAYDVIHEVEITLPEASVTALGLEPYTYTEASVTFDGETIPLIGVRLRGKIGSFRELSGKPKFKLDFNQYVEDQRFYGLETLSLNNSVADCSYIKEHISYALFEAAEVPASRTGIARVWVNGSPYGLYSIVEVPDDRFLKRHYAEPDGNLYDGKYVLHDDGYTLLDFAENNDILFQLEEGTDVGHEDIVGVSAALLASAGTSEYYAVTSEVVDWPLLHRMWAVEQFVGQNDGYGLNTNNYRVYFDPRDGLADLIPWDLDNSFLNDSSWGLSWYSPSGKLLLGCVIDNEVCGKAQQAVVAEILDVAIKRDLVTLLDELVLLIDDDAQSDPRRECAASSIATEQATVRAWLEAQDAAMRTFWRLD
jgi:hypothetical protein